MADANTFVHDWMDTVLTPIIGWIFEMAQSMIMKQGHPCSHVHRKK
jgi:hypothetical protein